MTPDFSLLLSEDSIVLLQRSQNGIGWIERGQAITSSKHLKSELGILKDILLGLNGKNTPLKVILPISQLFFTKFILPENQSLDIREVLEAKTPFKLEELNYHISGEHPKFNLIAVSKELLNEVERFLIRFDFQISGYTTMPNSDDFRTEPNLGSSVLTKFHEFIPDINVVKIIQEPNLDPQMLASEKKLSYLGSRFSNSKLDSIKLPLTKTPNPNFKLTEPGTIPKNKIDSGFGNERKLGSFNPFDELENRKSAEIRNRIRKLLITLLFIVILPTGFFSIFSLASWYNKDTTTNLTSNSSLNGLGPSQDKVNTKTLSSDKIIEEETLQSKILSEKNKANLIYTETGIWQLAPILKDIKTENGSHESYEATVDPEPAFEEAPSLFSIANGDQELPFITPLSPLANATEFSFNSLGLVEPSITGATNPDGILIYLGQPPVVAKRRPRSLNIIPINTNDEIPEELKPTPRPRNILEQTDNSILGVSSPNEFSKFAPGKRPSTIANLVKEINDFRENDSKKFSIAFSSRAKASGPSPDSVVKAAVIRRTIDLKRISLIGVFGTTSKSAALVRLSNGQIERLKVGDAFQGGRVASIRKNKLEYIKDGKTITLELPRS
jgi:hypothetical protein